MLLSVTPICPASKARKDGTSIIFLQYCKSESDKTLLNTQVAIPPAYWSKKGKYVIDKLPTTYGDASQINTEIRRQIRIAEDVITYAVQNNIEDVVSFTKTTFKPDFDASKLLEIEGKKEEEPKVNLDVFFQIEEYIKSKEKKVSPKMINVFNNMRDTLKAFEEYRNNPIKFESFDINFYEEFVEYMTYEHVHRRRKKLVKGFKISTIGKTIKQLRIFLNNRMRRKIISPINLEDFKGMDEESDAVYLNWNEITRVYQTDLSKYPHLEKYRDLFVFGCLTGLRFSDFSTVVPEDVRNRMLYKKQEKSDHRVVIPLRDEANYIFIHTFKRKIPKITNSDFNYYIKEVVKIAGITELIKFSHKRGNKDIIEVRPKYAWVTSHTCRRSFCTNEFLAGTPIDLIMKISGHKNLRDFYRYIRITPEEAGLKIKELWEQRGDMGIVNRHQVQHAAISA
ncbi:phage integrase SAM-like domain-containing protein [Agriterribacter sp.]|jgi:integrase|uniref:site-specific integrase n=1 Tax=Agriterribacter sp. TaxID=2821509 RepID=UPI002C326111|nr:phage integrase SAM-like domain-containing protein [Agriterribacter sp.]HRO44376.1 phage integrase SAM-like domain-containing protein [Agriterribacter sp.]HRQ16692.1 phage integrase SAM-like domain-containing protein [Agriterribacter sp.]